VLPLSNPTSRMEAVPADILAWTNGAAVVGTGSPCAPVTIGGVTHHIGQCNNAFVFPGIGLGVCVARARSLPDAAFAAAARAVSGFTGTAAGPGASIFPPLAELREVSHVVATAVAHALIDAGSAPPATPAENETRLTDAIWEPAYLEYRPARSTP
jgi:malate dehydrogenase (oxaloacetate-decarboxylating)